MLIFFLTLFALPADGVTGEANVVKPTLLCRPVLASTQGDLVIVVNPFSPHPMLLFFSVSRKQAGEGGGGSVASNRR